MFVLHCEHHEGRNGLSHPWRRSLGGPDFVQPRGLGTVPESGTCWCPMVIEMPLTEAGKWRRCHLQRDKVIRVASYLILAHTEGRNRNSHFTRMNPGLQSV